jgi:hypothetical protein
LALGALAWLIAAPAAIAQVTPVTMSGVISYTVPTTIVSLHVDRIYNDSPTDRSGTLRLELWAFSTPHTGATQIGYPLASCIVGTVNANTYIENIDCPGIAYIPPPAGVWYFTLFLTEYTGGPANDGFDPADYANFDNPVVVGDAVAPPTATAVEYYWAAHDHYFVTADPAEIAALDASPPGGWARTGLTFGAYAGPTVDSSPVCRFYIPPIYGDSHWYSASPAECAATRAAFPGLVLEAPNVFRVVLPDTATGDCPAGSIPVYRLWNNRVDTNHRYTTSVAVRNQMLARGYVAEGYGPDVVSMCAPQ